MGCSITACLLMAGHPVLPVAPDTGDFDHAENPHAGNIYGEAHREEARKQISPNYYLKI